MQVSANDLINFLGSLASASRSQNEENSQESQDTEATGILRCRRCLSSDLQEVIIVQPGRYQCTDCMSVSKGIRIKADCTECNVCQKGFKADATIVGCTTCHTWTCKKCADQIGERYSCPLCRKQGARVAVCGDRHYLDTIPADIKAIYASHARNLHFAEQQKQLRRFTYEVFYEFHRWLTASSKFFNDRGDEMIKPLTEFVPSKAILNIWQWAVCCTDTYTVLCDRIAGRFIHFQPFVKGCTNTLIESCNKLMQDAPDYRPWSETIWGKRSVEQPTLAITRPPTGEIRVNLGDNLCIIGPYHPTYTVADLVYKLKLKKYSLCFLDNKVDPKLTLQEQGIHAGDVLCASKNSKFTLDN